jgi:hypothetical protein
VKTDRYTPMTDRQARQFEKLGIPVDRSLTIHAAANLVNAKLQPTKYLRETDGSERDDRELHDQ